MKNLFILYILAGLVFICSCDDKKPTNSIFTINASGYITADFNDPNLTDSLSSLYYSTQTGRKALVSFTDTLDITYALTTNNQSHYSINLKPGLYDIKVETFHGYPKYFDEVLIIGDTNIDLNSKYDFFVIDTVIVLFHYADFQHPLSIYYTEEEERAFLEELNELSGHCLVPDEAVRITSNNIIDVPEVIFTEYRIPIVEGTRVFDAYSRVSTVMHFEAPDLPEVMRMGHQIYFYFFDIPFTGFDSLFLPILEGDYYTPPESVYYYYYNVWGR